MVRGTNVHIVMVPFAGDHAGDGVGLGDLLALQAFALNHVERIGVAAQFELAGAVAAYAGIDEQGGGLAVQTWLP
jgi:hypothetical protein